MINFVKTCKRSIYFASFLVENNKNLLSNLRPLVFYINHSSQARLFCFFQSRGLLVNKNSQLIFLRSKSKEKNKKHKKIVDEDSSDEDEENEEFDEDEDIFVEKDAEIKTMSVNSLRTDLILKNVLGISRKKIEENFYENKIRLNGNILLKKSVNLSEGDEIDLIKKIEDYNANTLNIGRIKILKMKQDPDSSKFVIKVWRSRSLIIENYDGENSWVETEGSN